MTRVIGTARRRAGAILLAAVLCAVGVLGTATPASAHAALVSTDPQDGATLATAPSTASLEFSEPVSIGSAGIRLFTADGDPITLDARAVDGTVTASLPALADDARYVIAWQVVSGDAHAIAGTIAFAVGDPPAGGAPTVELPDDGVATAWAAVAGAAQLLGLLVAAGMLFFERLALLAAIGTRTARRILLGAAILGTAGAIGVAIGAMARTGAPAWTTLIGALLAAALAGSIVARELRRQPARPPGVAILIVAALALATPVLVGHSASREPRWLIAGSDLVHLGAGAVWFGGVIGLAAFLVAASRRDADGVRAVTPQHAATVLGRFTVAAAIAAGALIVTGTTMAVVILGTWDAVLGTVYGRLLLLKLGLVAVALGLAVWTRIRLVPAILARPDGDGAWALLRGQLLREAVVLATVVVLTGALTGQSPNTTHETGGTAGAAQDDTTTTTATTTVSATADGIALTGTVEPTDDGIRIVFSLVDDAGEPVEAIEPPTAAARLAALDLGPVTRAAEATGAPGSYAVELTLPVGGAWTVDIGVRRSEFEQRTMRVTVTVP